MATRQPTRFRESSWELLRATATFASTRHGVLATGAALVGTLLLAFNRKIGDELIGWGGFSGWYAVAWLAFVAVSALFVSHHKIVSARDGQIAQLDSELRELRARPKPQLRFVGTDIDTEARLQVHVRDGQGGTMVRPIPDEMSWARVLVANDPGAAIGERADRVVATVVFCAPDGAKEVLRVEGRWAEAPQPPEIKQIGMSKEGRALDIDANADPHPLDVAMKFQKDMDCFAFNNENGFRAPVDGRYVYR